MPEIPEGAKAPKDHQSVHVKPEQHPDGWELLRDPVDTEEWETAALTAAVMSLSGETRMTASQMLEMHGVLVKTMQTELAVNATAFRTWIKSFPFADRYEKVIMLAGAYMAALGEADSSAT
ncbi:hypothetical protein [Glaciihabitans sp. dw_435]|uniref:hypothetical protein n=1 Tax=Glaciihabitans sp. dw_435 TaxID=2720081 RepID=UPI001BD3902F|nr:hypothetical protein [Glaciihabitans sp. dw_435]